jgi:hypothetical protein
LIGERTREYDLRSFENLKKASVIVDQELAKMLPPKKAEVSDRKSGDCDVKNILGAYKPESETGARDE